MRDLIAPLALAALAGCSEKNDVADKVEARAENRAEAMEEAAESMTNALQQNIVEQQADLVRQAGEERAEAIRGSELNPDQLTPEQRNALIKGEGTPAPARR
jgi:hypothetical protein